MKTAAPPQSGRVLDVTAPPFRARGDGITDDTLAVTRAIEAARSGDTIRFPEAHTFVLDSVDLGAVGKPDLTLDCRGAVLKKRTDGHFAGDNQGHLFRDTHGRSDGLRVLGGHFDLSGAHGTPGDTVSAFFFVRCNNLFFALPTITDGVEEGAKLYKCQDVTWVSPTIERVRNNGIQCHAPAVDGFQGDRPNQGWARWRIYGGRVSAVDDGQDGRFDGQGITFNSTDSTVSCRDVLVEGVEVSDCLRGLWAEFNAPDTRGSDITFRNNLVLRPRWFGIGLVGVIGGGVSGNHVLEPGTRPPGPDTSSEIAGVVISGSPGAPSERLKVHGNHVLDDRGVDAFMEYGILLKQSTELDVQGNTVRGATKENYSVHRTALGTVLPNP